MPQPPRRKVPSTLPPLPPLTLPEAVAALRQIEHELLTWVARWQDGLPTSARARLARIANTATRALARVPRR